MRGVGHGGLGGAKPRLDPGREQTDIQRKAKYQRFTGRNSGRIMRKTLRIVAIAPCPFPVNHGTPASIREIVQVQGRNGHEVHVVTYPLYDDIPLSGVTTHRVRRVGGSRRIVVGPTAQRPFFDLQMVWKVCQVIEQQGVDVIHGYNYEGALIGYLAKKWTGKPLVYTQLNSMIDELPSYDFIRPRFLATGLALGLDHGVPKLADHVIAISEELVAFLLKRRVPQERISLIRMGIDTAPFRQADPESVRSKYQLGGKQVVVYTGLLNEFQRIDYLIEAMPAIVAECPKACLLMVANYVDSGQLERLRGLAREAGVSEHILFTDERPFHEVPGFLAAADVAVVPRPDCPGVPIKMLNYMAAGKAIVCPQGSSKGLRHLRDAIIVPDNRPEEIARGVISLLRDPGLRHRLGECARRSVEELFGLEGIVSRIDEVYERVLAPGQWEGAVAL